MFLLNPLHWIKSLLPKNDPNFIVQNFREDNDMELLVTEVSRLIGAANYSSRHNSNSDTKTADERVVGYISVYSGQLETYLKPYIKRIHGRHSWIESQAPDQPRAIVALHVYLYMKRRK